MEDQNKNFSNIDEYIALFPEEQQSTMRELRRVIRVCAPAAKETISYQMPTFRGHHNLVHFAAYKSHLGFYPGGVVKEFEAELSQFKTSKGTVQFPWDKPLPIDLVERMVEFVVHQDNEKARSKSKKS